jgi:hypothetical protein
MTNGSTRKWRNDQGHDCKEEKKQRENIGLGRIGRKGEGEK